MNVVLSLSHRLNRHSQARAPVRLNSTLSPLSQPAGCGPQPYAGRGQAGSGSARGQAAGMLALGVGDGKADGHGPVQGLCPLEIIAS